MDINTISEKVNSMVNIIFDQQETISKMQTHIKDTNSMMKQQSEKLDCILDGREYHPVIIGNLSKSKEQVAEETSKTIDRDKTTDAKLLGGQQVHCFSFDSLNFPIPNENNYSEIFLEDQRKSVFL